MLTVTAFAKEKIKARLQGMKTDPEVMIRLIPSPVNQGKWKMILDKEKEEDHVVKCEEGIKVLLIGADLAPELEKMIIDFRKTPEGTGFAIYKLPSKPASSEDKPT